MEALLVESSDWPGPCLQRIYSSFSSVHLPVQFNYQLQSTLTFLQTKLGDKVSPATYLQNDVPTPQACLIFMRVNMRTAAAITTNAYGYFSFKETPRN